MLIIGIDPGASGGITFIDSKSGMIDTHKMPEVEEDIAEMLAATYAPRFAFLERVHAMPKQGVSSTFKFGSGYGFIRGVLVALGIPREFPTPQAWQKALGCLTRGDKNVSKAKASELWPGRKWTHATADSALIAEYGRRHLHATGRLP